MKTKGLRRLEHALCFGAGQEMFRSSHTRRGMLHAAEAENSILCCLDQAVNRNAAQRYLLLAGQLEAFFEEDKIFRVKPKAHQLVELARHDVNPRKIWTLGQELWTLALGRRREGKFSMRACCFLPSPEEVSCS